MPFKDRLLDWLIGKADGDGGPPIINSPTAEAWARFEEARRIEREVNPPILYSDARQPLEQIVSSLIISSLSETLPEAQMSRMEGFRFSEAQARSFTEHEEDIDDNTPTDNYYGPLI